MLAARIICPRCGQSLTVSEHAPPRVSCPRCLGELANPASPESGLPRPVPVIPLDRQVERDSRAGAWLVAVVLALLSAATLATFVFGNAPGGWFVLLLVGGVVAVAWLLGVSRGGVVGGHAPGPPARPGPPPLPGEPGVLEYGAPPRAYRPAATAGAVAAGFSSAVGVCALGFVILTVSAEGSTGSRRSNNDYNALILAGVVIMVVAFIIAAVRLSGRWHGFGPGSIAGLCLGLAALGPCAACYLLTLG